MYIHPKLPVNSYLSQDRHPKPQNSVYLQVKLLRHMEFRPVEIIRDGFHHGLYIIYDATATELRLRDLVLDYSMYPRFN